MRTTSRTSFRPATPRPDRSDVGRFKYTGVSQYSIGNKGFIGRLVPPPAAVVTSFTSIFLGTASTGPSFNGPGQNYAGAMSTQVDGTPSGVTSGLFTPDPFQVNGVDLIAFGEVGSGINTFFILILNSGTLLQNHFTQASATLSNGHALLLTSASAQFNNPWDDRLTGSGYSTWVWPTVEPQFLSYTTPITVT